MTRGLRSWAMLLDRGLALCDRVGTSAQRAQILYGMQSRYTVEGRLEKSALITDEMVRLFRETQGSEPPRSAFAMMAGVRVQLGRFQEACDDIDPRPRSRPEPAPAPPGVAGRELRSHRSCLAIARALVPRSSGHRIRAGIRALCASPGELGQPFSQAIAATYLALLQQLRADSATFRRQAQEALELATSSRGPITGRGPPSSSPTRRRSTARSPRDSSVFGARSRALRRRGRAPPAVLPRAAGGRPPPGRRCGQRPRRRGGSPVPRSRDE